MRSIAAAGRERQHDMPSHRLGERRIIVFQYHDAPFLGSVMPFEVTDFVSRENP